MLPRQHDQCVLLPRHWRELGLAHEEEGLPLLLNTSLLIDLNHRERIYGHQ